MRRVLIATVLAAGLFAVSPAMAGDGCVTPSYLLTTENPLSKVAAAVKSKKSMDILVVGSGSSALAGPDGAASSYPARLEAALREKLAGVTVSVRTDIRPKKTTAETADTFGQLLEKLPQGQKPDLVVWQTGTIDAMRSVDPDDFRTALANGISALQQTGADVLLMNLQYNPRMETMLSVTSYIDTMRVVAQEREVPLFDRFSIMRHWSDVGNVDLFGSVHGFGMAKRVHDCIGQSLAAMIVEASRINPAELRIQR